MNLIFRFPILIGNALFTDYGRLNVKYRWRTFCLHTFSDFKRGVSTKFRFKDGRLFVVHPVDQLSMQMFLDREYEPLETAFSRAAIRPGDIVLDIGANIGYFSALFDHLVTTSGAVHAFEPGPATFKKLQKTIEILGLNQVKANQSALGAKSGTVSFIASTSGNDAQQSVRDWDGFQGVKESGNVNVTTLDHYIASNRISSEKIAFLKCDVEGYETEVFSGAAQLLAGENPPVLMLEVNKPALLANGHSPKELLDLLGNYNLYYAPLSKDSRHAQKFSGCIEKLPPISNFFGLPKHGRNTHRVKTSGDTLVLSEVK